MRDPAKPDDFAHALAFAMMIIFHLTDHKMLKVTPTDMLAGAFEIDDAVDTDAIMEIASRI